MALLTDAMPVTGLRPRRHKGHCFLMKFLSLSLSPDHHALAEFDEFGSLYTLLLPVAFLSKYQGYTKEIDLSGAMRVCVCMYLMPK